MARAAVVELPLAPGALSDDTDLAAKLRAVDMDKVRIRGNRWETIKGWEVFHANGMSAGTARAIHTYADIEGCPIVIAASESVVNVWFEDTRYVVTPVWKDIWLGQSQHDGPSTVEYNGVAGQVLITWAPYETATDTFIEADHDLVVGDVITFSNVTQTAGDNLTLAGTHTVIEVPSSQTFVVDVGTGDTIGVTRPFSATVAFRTGLVTGTGRETDERPRIPTIDNFGENAVFCFSDGSPIFAWQPTPVATELIENGTFTGGITDWEATGAWTAGTNTLQYIGGATGGDVTQDIDGKLDGGKVYEMTFQITLWDPGMTIFRVLIDSVDIFPPLLAGGHSAAQMQKTFTFRFVCPANPEKLIFRADAGGGSDNMEIDNVSVKAMPRAFPINEAPQKNYSLFVDGNRILNVLGSVEADGDFDPLLLRWSDQDNYREWIPNTDNVAGEISLGKGSMAICGSQVGERNLLLTDTSAFTATFTINGYSIRTVGQGCGAIGPNALAVYNNRAYWAALNSFYAYDGAQVLVIECPVKDQYVSKLSRYQEPKVFAWTNIEYGEVWFHYPHTDDGTEISRYLTFNFVEQTNPWAFGTWDRTCMTPAAVFRNPIGIDTADTIWRHEIGTSLSGDIVLPFVETGYATGQAGDRWMGCRRYYPDIENQVNNMLLTVTGKRAPQGQNNTQVIGPLLMIPNESKLDFVLSCRQLKFRWESIESVTNWRLGVVGLEMKADKERR